LTRQLGEFYEQLETDVWRAEVGFSRELGEPLSELLVAGIDDAGVVKILANWLGDQQPCLFGRIAAKRDLIEYCVLREADLLGSDDAVAAKITSARLRCYQRAWRGDASAFIIVVLSRRLAEAKPGPAVQGIAQRLLQLYLGCDSKLDEVYLEELFLEVPNRERNAWKWAAGVNYFSAQGDKRWWQDHRIPAGVAFSVNSVGHMVKSRVLSGALNDLNEALGLEGGEDIPHNIDSLGDALAFAMRTIQKASVGPSGRATALLPMSEGGDLPSCPFELKGTLIGKNHCEYLGLYHTDVTLPHEYFQPDVERPTDLETHQLDFTYLFDESLENPDHTVMGKGLQIREDGERASTREKRERSVEVEIPIENAPLLLKALSMD
jgi:hypothetical protein